MITTLQELELQLEEISNHKRERENHYNTFNWIFLSILILASIFLIYTIRRFIYRLLAILIARFTIKKLNKEPETSSPKEDKMLNEEPDP